MCHVVTSCLWTVCNGWHMMPKKTFPLLLLVTYVNQKLSFWISRVYWIQRQWNFSWRHQKSKQDIHRYCLPRQKKKCGICSFFFKFRSFCDQLGTNTIKHAEWIVHHFSHFWNVLFLWWNWTVLIMPYQLTKWYRFPVIHNGWYR